MFRFFVLFRPWLVVMRNKLGQLPPARNGHSTGTIASAWSELSLGPMLSTLTFPSRVTRSVHSMGYQGYVIRVIRVIKVIRVVEV